MEELRILSPTAILGYGFPESSFGEGMRRKPHLIAVDAGSSTRTGITKSTSGRRARRPPRRRRLLARRICGMSILAFPPMARRSRTSRRNPDRISCGLPTVMVRRHGR